MRMLVNITVPNGKFNQAVRNGTAGETMGRILEEIKPEAVYFTNPDGKRGAVLIVNVDKPSDIPKFAEPWFLNFDADCQFQILMSPQDLEEAGLDEIGKKWA